MKKLRWLVLPTALLIPNIASAHSGIMDRWLGKMINLRATCCTVYAVQLVLVVIALLLLFWKGNPITGIFRKGATALSSYRYMNLFSAWFLAAFVLTPYLTILDYSLFFFAGARLLLVGVLSILFVSIPILRKWITKEKTLCVMLHLSFSAFVGYIVYFTIWDSELIQTLFSEEDDCYPVDDGPFWRPDQFTGLDNLFWYGLDLLAITLIPYLVAAIVMFIRERKQGKPDSTSDTVKE